MIIRELYMGLILALDIGTASTGFAIIDEIIMF